jgi:hypothetical protein
VPSRRSSPAVPTIAGWPSQDCALREASASARARRGSHGQATLGDRRAADARVAPPAVTLLSHRPVDGGLAMRPFLAMADFALPCPCGLPVPRPLLRRCSSISPDRGQPDSLDEDARQPQTRTCSSGSRAASTWRSRGAHPALRHRGNAHPPPDPAHRPAAVPQPTGKRPSTTRHRRGRTTPNGHGQTVQPLHTGKGR